MEIHNPKEASVGNQRSLKKVGANPHKQPDRGVSPGVDGAYCGQVGRRSAAVLRRDDDALRAGSHSGSVA